jgi:hypothetical protein
MRRRPSSRFFSRSPINRFALNFQIRFNVNPKKTRRNGPESSFLCPSASR